jgi:threonyl-tRNA synthetase
MGIADRHAEAVERTRQCLLEQGYRVESDLRNEKIGFKIREHTLQRVPYLLVIGDKEAENNSVSVRTRNGEDLGVQTVTDFAQLLADDVAQLGRTVVSEEATSEES